MPYLKQLEILFNISNLHLIEAFNFPYERGPEAAVTYLKKTENVNKLNKNLKPKETLDMLQKVHVEYFTLE